MHAAGFPYYAIAGTSLHLTSGNVSALAGVDDDPRFFSFSAPVQPGNSGGPLIDAHGAVLGLVVARLSEDFIVEATGTLPQNVNYALAEPELAAFLAEAGVAHPSGGLGRFAIDEGAPAGLRVRRGPGALRVTRTPAEWFGPVAPRDPALTFNPGRVFIWPLYGRFPYAFHTVQAVVNRSGNRLLPRMPDSIGRRAHHPPVAGVSVSFGGWLVALGWLIFGS